MLASLVSPPGVSLTQKRRQQDAVTMSLSVAPCRCATSTLPCATSLLRRCARSTPPLRYVDPALRHVAVPDLPRRVSCRRTSTLPGSVLKTSRAWKISELNPGQRVSCLRTSVTFVYQDIGDVTEPAAPQYASEPPRTARFAVLDVETTGLCPRLRRALRRDRAAGGLHGRRAGGRRLGAEPGASPARHSAPLTAHSTRRSCTAWRNPADS